VTLTGHQPTYAPWLGLIAKIAQADTFVWWDDVQQEDSGYENRVLIRTREGSQWLTVPVHRDRDAKVKDVRIAGDAWRRKHWRTWEQNYRQALYAERHLPFLDSTYAVHWDLLAELDEHLLRYLLWQFGLNPRWVRLSSLGLKSKGSQLVLDVCEALGADHFHFGAHGTNYADVEAFGRAGVSIEFQDFQIRSYAQAFPGFFGGLSAFDFLLNHDPADAIEVLGL